MFSGGSRDRYNAVASLEWRPIEGMHFYFDGIFGRQFNDLNRSDINFGVRSGAGSQPLIPQNVTSCSPTGSASRAVPAARCRAARSTTRSSRSRRVRSARRATSTA